MPSLAKPPRLFSSWTIGEMELPNRLVIPPMCMYTATDGKMGAFHHMHVGGLAASGAGLVILEASAVLPEGRISPQCCGIWDDATADAMKAVLDEVHQYSKARIALQLNHAGRKASTHPLTVRVRGQIAPDEPSGWQTVGPTNVPFSATENPPVALSVEEIKRVVEAFAKAAQRAVAAGFDGIELHGAHGYLIHEFLSPLSNERTDNYGGSLENRMRMPLEVFKAVRAAVPTKVPVWIRISATDLVASGGWDVPEAIVFCKELKKLGCDVIHVSAGGLTSAQELDFYPGYQVQLAKAIRDGAGVQTIAVGMITEPEQAETVLASGAADAVAVGRSVLFNPRWPMEAARRLGGELKNVHPIIWRCEPKCPGIRY